MGKLGRNRKCGFERTSTGEGRDIGFVSPYFWWVGGEMGEKEDTCIGRLVINLLNV